jgi:membrane-associated phospholipid phosphatase
VIGGTMIWVDAPVDRMVRDNARAWEPLRRFSHLTSWYGKSGRNAFIVSAAITGAVAAGGWLSDDDRMVDTAAIMAESVVFTTVLTYAGKMLFGRKRPYNNEGPHQFEWFVGPGNEPSVSFPSGHASTAFALAGAGAGRYPYWYVQVPAYALAASAGLQRIDTRKHWTSDVIAGAVLGYAVSTFLVDRYNCDDPESGGTPAMSVSLGFRF